MNDHLHVDAVDASQLEALAVVRVPALLSVAAVSRLLDCSTRTVRRRIADGLLPAVLDHGGHVYVRGDDLRGYIDALQRVGSSAAPARRQRASARRYDFLHR